MSIERPAGDRGKARLVERVVRAGGWTILGFGTNQFLRFAGNLILTRLLFPEAFGLMALVQAVMLGVALLSDVGIEQSIIQNKRGNAPGFLNTAWTVKVVRGVLIWVVLYLLASPIAAFYREPLLAELLPVVGLTAIISGLASTKIATADRDLGIGKATVIDVGSYALGLLVMVVWAWIDRSVWALVMGNIVGAAAKTVASHAWLDGVANRFAWEAESRTALLALGRWFFVSSALTYLGGEGIRLLIGHLLDVRVLAFFSLAIAMDQFPRQIVIQISGRVLFPAYSEVVRERPDTLVAVMEKSRVVQTLPYWLVCALLVYFGRGLMEFLYDDRYKDSGWMLQILALGSLVSSLVITYNGILWAKGMVRTSTWLLAIQLLIQIPAMVIGNYLGGAAGLVLALAVAGWMLYPVHAFVYARLALWQPKLDLPLIALSVLIAIPVLSGKGLFGPSG